MAFLWFGFEFFFALMLQQYILTFPCVQTILFLSKIKMKRKNSNDNKFYLMGDDIIGCCNKKQSV